MKRSICILLHLHPYRSIQSATTQTAGSTEDSTIL
nr:MAG TPA: hypothetical protein [Caudoviricetes sp.]